MNRHLKGIVLAVAMLAAAPFLAARPTVPPPAAPRRPTEPARLDLDGQLLPVGAIARAGTLLFRHGGEIGRVVFSPDGRTAYSTCPVGPNAAAAKFAYCWSVPGGRELGRFGGGGIVYAV